MSYFASIDQGTTSSRFIVFDEKGKVVAQHQEEFTQYLPDNVSVEHNPEEIWISVQNCILVLPHELMLYSLTIGIF